MRHLVNVTQTNQFRFYTLLLMTIRHTWHACKLRSIFYMKGSFLGLSIFGSIDLMKLDFPVILVLSPVLSLYNLCIMACFKYTPHTNYDIRCDVTLRHCLKVPQNCLKVPQVCLKVPRKSLKVPPLFSGTISPQHLTLASCRL